MRLEYVKPGTFLAKPKYSDSYREVKVIVKPKKSKK